MYCLCLIWNCRIQDHGSVSLDFFYTGLSSKNHRRSSSNFQEGKLKIQKISGKWLKTDGSSFPGGMCTMTQQTWHPKAGRSTYMYVRQQPGRHGWRQLTDSLMAGTTRRLVPAERRDWQPGWSAMRLSGQRYCGIRARLCTPELNSLRDAQSVQTD